VVLTVPSGFDEVGKRRLVDAARVVGMEVLAVVDALCAVAVYYGYTHAMKSTTSRTVLFVDAGHHFFDAMLVHFSPSAGVGLPILVRVLSRASRSDLGAMHAEMVGGGGWWWVVVGGGV
jgi:molecular chaperone DnaK (HSP70)